jgi:Skp family chaperone for outer membrane proteins
MRHALIILAAIAALATPALAADVGFIDLDRAIRESSDGKKAIAETQEAEKAHAKAKADYEAAEAAAAKDKKPAPKPIATDDAVKAQNNQREQGVANMVFSRIKVILPAVAKARKLSGITHQMLWASPGIDVTAEVVKRYDAGEWRTAVADADALKAENAALKAKLAALEKRKGAKADANSLPNLDPRAMTATRPNP